MYLGHKHVSNNMYVLLSQESQGGRKKGRKSVLNACFIGHNNYTPLIPNYFNGSLGVH